MDAFQKTDFILSFMFLGLLTSILRQCAEREEKEEGESPLLRHTIWQGWPDQSAQMKDDF
jgi:hypothetical protein